jgi:hypothetical protein
MGPGLISGFHGDACELVRYNRSGIYTFSTSVQSASKYAIFSVGFWVKHLTMHRYPHDVPVTWIAAIVPIVVLALTSFFICLVKAE